MGESKSGGGGWWGGEGVEVRPAGACLQGLLNCWLPRVTYCKNNALDFEAHGYFGVFYLYITLR